MAFQILRFIIPIFMAWFFLFRYPPRFQDPHGSNDQLKTAVRFSTPDGVSLFERYSPAVNASEEKALVVLVHGFAEHSGRYDHVVHGLTQRGFTVYAYDARSHGQSSGVGRCYIEDTMDLVNDLHQVLCKRVPHYIQQRKPLFVLAHSLGALVASTHFMSALKHKQQIENCDVTGLSVDGFIATGLFASVSEMTSPLKIKLGRLIASLIPQMPVERGIKPERIASDPLAVEGYRNDSLNCHMTTIPAATGSAIVQHLEKFARPEMFSKLQLPILMLHGGEDRIAPWHSAKNLFDSIQSEDKQWKLYEGLGHELLQEKERDSILNEIVQWMEKHL